MFTNYNCRGYLGQPVLNDCEEFARNLTEHFNYKCVFICNADCKTARNLLIQMLSIPDKKVVFFYSGHGYSDGFYVYDGGLKYEEIKLHFSECRSKTKIR